MEAMLLGPLRLLFLLLMSGVGASTRWILFLHKMSGETFCSISCVRLGQILSLPCEGISSLASDGRTVFFPGVVGGAYDGGVKLLFPLVFNGDGDGDGIASAEDLRRRLCSSWGFFFRVGALITGGGFCARGFLLLFPFDFGRMEEVTMNLMRLLFPLLLAAVGGEAEWDVWTIRFVFGWVLSFHGAGRMRKFRLDPACSNVGRCSMGTVSRPAC